MATDPWAAFNPQPLPDAGPLASPPKEPKEPKEPKTTYRVLTPEEARSRGLPDGPVYQESSEGKIDAVGGNASEDQRKAAAQKATLESIVGQVNRVQELYDSGIRDESLLNAFGALDAVGPEAGRFNSAGQGVADQGVAAFRTPGVGAQSDFEAKQFASANTPQAGDWDAAIEEKLSNIRRRVDANRAALGLPPADWKGVKRNGDTPVVAGAEKPPALAAPNYNPADPTQRPIPGAGLDNGGGGAQQLATGAAERMDNPALAGVRQEYITRLQQGATAEDLIAWAHSAGVSPSADASIRAQVQFRDKNPKVPIEQYDTSQLDDMATPLSGTEQTLNSVAQSPAGTFAINAGNAVALDSLDSIVGATGGNAERTRLGMDLVGEKNPKAAIAGTLAGGVGAALGVEGGLALGGLRAGLGRGLVADSLYGAGVGAGATDYSASGGDASLQDRLTGAGLGAGAGLVGSYLGNRIGRGVGAMARGVSDPSVRALQAVDTPLTIGQQVGRSGRIGATIKGVEDRLSGLPLVGDAINARRMEGVEVFNSAAFDRALAPISGSVKGKVGEEAMQIADDAVSAAYEKALKGKAALADRQFAQDFNVAVSKAANLARVGPEVAEEMADIVAPYMTQGSNKLTGEAMQQISRDLRAYKAKWTNDTAGRRVGKAIDEFEDAIFGMFRRQAPEVLEDYNKAKLAAQRLFTLERAVLAGKNTEGVFTPAQLGTADKQATIAYGGRRKTSTGKGEFHDMQRAGQNVLPNKVPDSGTAGRWLLPAAVVGGSGAGAGVGAAGGDAQGGAATGLTLGLILAGAYSKAGQRLLTKPGRGIGGKPGRLLESAKTRRAIQAASASSAAALTSQ